jgi:hypothetical protein
VNQHISSVFTLVLVKVADHWVGLVFKVILLLCGVTAVNLGFVMNRRWEWGLGYQVNHFILYLTVMQDHESTFLAPKAEDLST